MLARHRQLAARLPGYDDDQGGQGGGADYVFLRGSAAPSQGLFTVKLSGALTRFIAVQGGETAAAVLLASERNGHGHVCLDLRGVLSQPGGLLGQLRDDEAPSVQVRQALAARLAGLFGPAPPDTPAPGWQRLAVRSAFVIITGGPGTGKTTTVVRLLAVLQGLAVAGGEPPLRIELAAPTGKAAARLNASIARQVRPLAGHQAPDGSIPTQVKTLHRLLGTRPDSRGFRHHAAHPLACGGGMPRWRPCSISWGPM